MSLAASLEEGTPGSEARSPEGIRALDPPGRLTGRCALVTGGSGEIGVAIARAMAVEGAAVAVLWRTRRNEAERAVEAVVHHGGKGIAVHGRLEDHESVRGLREEVHRRIGPIDTLVNCAGINRDCLFSRMTDEQWNEVIQVNLSGVFRCCKAFADEIVASGHGRIINISSVVGLMGNVGQVNYAASKSGMHGFSKALARELARHGTTVNVVAPGFIDTAMVRGIPEKVRVRILSQIPLGRFGTTEEVAAAVVYLASDEAAYITGSILSVNGGMYL